MITTLRHDHRLEGVAKLLEFRLAGGVRRRQEAGVDPGGPGRGAHVGKFDGRPWASSYVHLASHLSARRQSDAHAQAPDRWAPQVVLSDSLNIYI